MLTDRELTNVIAKIGEASDYQLAEVLDVAIDRLGHAGRPAAEALLSRLGARTAYHEEGLAQIVAVEGVLDGRTDSL